ncbi:MAG: deoxyribodipyrimidine photo-lyase, partial [Flavobacteriales bacterium]|nr:deoxyribodipyrimidine photo-lyase [Flavobacteriales bacterium]
MPVAIFWFRRDLRLHDNAGLYHALRSGQPVLPLFIFDTNILDDLPERRDARVEFIHQALAELKQKLEALGSTLLVRHGKPPEVWAQLLREHEIKALFTNRDYEPYALERDAAVQTLLAEKNIPFHTSKDHVIFEKNEVLKDDGTPYTVFTPYSRKWRAKLETRWKTVLDEEGRPERASFYLSPYPTEKYAGNLLKAGPLPFPALTELGFEPAGIPFPPAAVARGLIRTYDKT